jgi:sporulation protein YlmC with PRC-barrel domain
VSDDGHAVHYTALERGTPVFSSDGEQVGTVDEVLDNFREHIFDGLVIRTSGGERRFVDAPEVARTAERAVTLTITAAECAELPPPPKQGPELGGTIKRLFGRRR